MYQPVPVDKDKLHIAKKRADMYRDIIDRVIKGETYQSIGNSYGISRQRVEQIIKKLYLNERR